MLPEASEADSASGGVTSTSGKDGGARVSKGRVLDHGLETSWQDAAQDRQHRIRMELASVKRVARITRDRSDRLMMQETS